MSQRTVTQVATGLLAATVAAGCAGSPTVEHRAAAHRAAGRPGSELGTAAGCPKTVIRHVAGPPGSSGQDLVPGTSAYGNTALVTILSVDGVIRPSGDMVRPDGSIWWKFPWWRLVRGHLTISGRRLDAPAPPLIPDVPNGYGAVGFQASGVVFPRQGCWQVTGRLAGSSLTFVALVTTTPSTQ